MARLAITTRRNQDEHGTSIVVEAGRKQPLRPAAHGRGTRIEVTDLFAWTPARLKFLKSDRAEAQAVVQAVKRLAMAHPGVRFELSGDGMTGLDLPSGGDGRDGLLARLGQVLGRDFAANAVPVAIGREMSDREPIRLDGYAGLPTYHRATPAEQYLFVNGRPVRDKLMLGAVRAAYADLIPRDRHPVLALFLTLPGGDVDVNVHPAKAEVRFRDAGLIRGLIVGALRQALAGAGHRAADTGGAAALGLLSRSMPGAIRGTSPTFPAPDRWPGPVAGGFAEEQAGFAEEQAGFAGLAAPTAAEPGLAAAEAHPLGAARAQLHDTYIVAQTAQGIVIVDQHAAHERLVYERLKTERAGRAVPRQLLLVPEIVELDPAEAERLAEAAPALEALGLVLEGFGPGAVAVREVPAAIAGGDVRALVRDLADGIAEWGGPLALERAADRVLATFACHHSVRAGRRLKPAEMDALLREMERTPGSGQCNHGRPTYVELRLPEIERLFGRR